MHRLRRLRAHLGTPDAAAPAPRPVANDPGEYFVLDADAHDALVSAAFRARGFTAEEAADEEAVVVAEAGGE
eukprot:COSAG04_NODE_13901_length_588_cov_0.451943_1_plen_71_part_01